MQALPYSMLNSQKIMSPRIFHIWAGIASVIALFAGTASVTFYNAEICPDTSFNWWLNFVPSLGYVCLFGAAWWWSVGAFACDPDGKLSDLFTGRHIFVLWLTSIGALCMGLLFFQAPPPQAHSPHAMTTGKTSS